MALAALAGGAAVFGMAPFNLWPVMIAALAALFALTDGLALAPGGWRKLFATGWAFGFAYFGGGLYWVGEAFYVDPATIWMTPFAVTLLPAGMALFFAGACALSAAIPRRGAAGALILTASFCAVEFARGFIFTGFPWNLFGSAFIDAAAAQGAAIAGVYGLTFVALLAGFSLPPLLRERGAFRFVPAGAAVMLLGVAFAFGFLRAAPTPRADAPLIRIVQPDNPQSEKSQRDYTARLWRRLIGLTAAPGAGRIDVFIWPEGVTPFFLDEAPEALSAIGDMLRPGQALIAGSARRELTDEGATRYFNALLLIDDAGRVEQVYDKSHLVPFGEYLPFPAFFRALDIASLTARIGGAFTPGPGLRTLTTDGLPGFSPLVCYEALFPGAVVGEGQRPGWLVNLTDDSWFGVQTGPHQHLTAARFRAIEEGLPLARSATTGISAMIDAQGALVAATRMQEATFIDAALPPAYEATIFGRYGHALFLALTLIAGVTGLLRNRKPF